VLRRRQGFYLTEEKREVNHLSQPTLKRDRAQLEFKPLVVSYFSHRLSEGKEKDEATYPLQPILQED